MLLIKENIRLLIGAVVVLFAVVLIITLIVAGRKTPTAEIGSQVYKLEVADTDQEKQIGLSGRDSLGENQGMVFVFDNPGLYSFWMKEMKFPIDIIYLNGNRVVTVIENAAAPSSENEELPIYQPEEKANRVLELKAGTAKAHGIQKGSEIKLENL